MLSWEEPEDLARSWSRGSGDLPWDRPEGAEDLPRFVRIRAVRRVRYPRRGLRRHVSPRIAALVAVLLGCLGGTALGSRPAEQLRPGPSPSIVVDDLDGLLERERRLILRGLWMMEALEGSPVP